MWVCVCEKREDRGRGGEERELNVHLSLLISILVNSECLGHE